MFPHTRRNLALERVGHVNLALSPHTRRNLFCDQSLGIVLRSISAHAEEPSRPWQRKTVSRVYLRTRGGTRRDPRTRDARHGLSPHTRRNRNVERG